MNPSNVVRIIIRAGEYKSGRNEWIGEDRYGIEAAKKAGLKVMGLYNSKLYQDLTDANLIISSLKQIMEEDIW